MPIVRPIGRERGSLAPLLIVTLFWFNGCQSLSAQSESTSASDTGWKITGQAGLVLVRSPDRSFWQRAWPGARIPPGGQIATFKGSRLEMASAGDQVMASGPSRFTLPNAEHNGVRVHQDAGTLRYKVQSAAKRHFEVKTPHFSTVVKGTSFLVSIARTSSEVFVDDGRVLILDPDGEPLAELTAGQRPHGRAPRRDSGNNRSFQPIVWDRYGPRVGTRTVGSRQHHGAPNNGRNRRIPGRADKGSGGGHRRPLSS